MKEYEVEGNELKVWVDPIFENSNKGEYYEVFTIEELQEMINELKDKS